MDPNDVEKAYDRYWEYADKVGQAATQRQHAHSRRLWNVFCECCKRNDIDPWQYSEREGSP